MIRLLEDYATVEMHASLKKYNTYRVEGSAKYLISPNSITDLSSVIKILKESNEKFYILGNGSNVIINDKIIIINDPFIIIAINRINNHSANKRSKHGHEETFCR